MGTRTSKARYAVLTAGVAVGLIGLLAPSTASAAAPDGEEADRQELVSLFSSVAPEFFARVSPTVGPSSVEQLSSARSSRATDRVELPSEASEAVLVGNAEVGLAPQDAEHLGEALQLQSNAVAFVGETVTQVAVDKGAGLYSLASVLADESAGDRFSYDLQSPGNLLIEIGDNGGALFLDDDNVVGGAYAPWAVDAAGVEVPTHYVVEDGALVQVVDHIGGGFTYPIIADPTYYGESLISSVVTRNPAAGRELSVHTSTWWKTTATFGGTVISITVRNQVTDEFARITPSPWDTTGARQQVSCHAYYATLKDPWNIELWRPTVGEAATVAAACNPS
ncbi:DUF2599 domain-containing protein [Microbacterium memoriense]|uniref:DUF2599 domain-containing protein n=1 Tax=Microbacterium memoriense TaxID=2978350 RepID=A0ABT2PF99_9MICO|nr:DUF2599 domain-containing protein [Microbacterium memoriense]MCT9003289.1 DUF2599 domain-containing protein [Microbacterium memoriense]